jgi:hypothetical protein
VQPREFGDNQTKFTLFGHVNEGVPSSYVYSNGGTLFGDTLDARHLIYVPTGPTDPNVIFTPFDPLTGVGFDTDAFFDFINASGLSKYAGGIAPRNVVTSHWWHKYDIKLEQELPGFGEEHRFAAFVLIENVGNLINDDWGVFKEYGFPRNQSVVQIAQTTGDGPYVYQQFFSPAPQSRVADPSLWEIRFGISYDF